MKTIIYLRHGEDEHSGYRNDQQLTSRGKKEARYLAKDLVERYGIPDVIYCSPLFRARQTKKHMLRYIEKTHGPQNIKTKNDPRLSRYFTHRECRNPDVRDDTYRRNPPLDEDWEDFKTRVYRQLDSVKRNDKYQIVWCITHTLVLKRVAKYEEIERDSYVEFLDTLILEL